MIEVGTRVAYSREWLRSVGMVTGDIPFARGIVRKINGRIASVDWVNKEGRLTSQSSCLINNLIAVDRLHLERN